MKNCFAFIIALLIATISFGQTDTLGFTNPNGSLWDKAEAKNLMVNGKKEGKWLECFISSGDLDMKYPAKDSSSTKFYCLTIYKHGIPFGIAREYYKSGKLLRETLYTNGKKNGIEKWYYENGAIMSEFPYTNGAYNGTIKYYYENGKLQGTIQFVNDKQTDQKFFDESGNEIKQ